MSESLSSVDFLSFCHSLADILRYVRYQDVPSCRLVNKRLSEVIQKNYLTLPRRKIEIDIKTISLEWIPSMFVAVKFSTPFYSEKVVYITEKRTTIMKSWYEVRRRETEGKVDKYYRENGIPSENNHEDHEDEQIWEVIRDKHKDSSQPFEEMDWTLSYKNDGIENGLRRFLSILCPHYNFKSFKLSQEFANGYNPQQKKQAMIPEECLYLIEEVLRQNRCFCDELDIIPYTPRIGGLVSVTDCREISVLTRTTEDFMMQLFEMINLNRRLRLCIKFEEFESLEEIGQFLEQWETGSLSLDQVELRIFYSLTTTWGHKIDYLMSELKEALFEKKTIPNKQIDYVVTRLVDNKSIQLTCEGNFLSIKEFL